jgi:hypothetical protein
MKENYYGLENKIFILHHYDLLGEGV